MKIGCDIVDIKRFKDISREFILKYFTEKEIAYADGKVNKAETYAGTFAAKEAFSKALGTGIGNGFKLTDVEIVRGINGSPKINLYNSARDLAPLNAEIAVTISHSDTSAVAFVVIS